MDKFPKLGESLGILCIRKLFNDITIRNKFVDVPDHGNKDNYFPAPNSLGK